MGQARKVKIGLLQTWADADPATNLKRTLQLAHTAADRGAQIISTQELFRSPYFCQSEDHANFALAEEDAHSG
jgi:N-carbamoylputrescine amidase